MPIFFWTKYTFKDAYAYLSRLHCKTFHRLKYYFHAFTEYYNRNVRESSHQSSSVGIVHCKNIGKFSNYVLGNFSWILRKHRFSYRKWKYFIGLRKIDRIFGLIFELLGNISKRWEHFTNLLKCRKFFPWKVEIIPQKRKFVHFFWIFFHLNYEIYQFFLINWIFLRPNSIGTISSSMSEIFPTHFFFQCRWYFFSSLKARRLISEQKT